jgi:hypothetical protein
MKDLPQVYGKYDLLFTPRLIPRLRNLRGEEWARLIDSLSTLPETHPDALAFCLMMIQLGSCLSCEMDSYRAQRGCLVCAQQAVVSFKGNDKQLIKRYEHARASFDEQSGQEVLKKAA